MEKQTKIVLYIIVAILIVISVAYLNLSQPANNTETNISIPSGQEPAANTIPVDTLQGGSNPDEI